MYPVGQIFEGALTDAPQYADIITELFASTFSNTSIIIHRHFSPLENRAQELATLMHKIAISSVIEPSDKARVINEVLQLIPPETNLSEMYENLAAKCALSELGMLAALYTDEERVSPLILAVIKHYALTEDPNEEAIRDCLTFIVQILSMGDDHHPVKQPALTLFLKKLYEHCNIDILVLNELHSIDDPIVLKILWSLPEACLSRYIGNFNMDKNPYAPAILLTDLFSLEQDNSNRALLIKAFTDRFNGKEFNKFLMALYCTDSTTIPFLCTGINDTQFERFVSSVSRSVRNQIFLNSLPKSNSDMQWIINNLKGAHTQNRLAILCEQAEMDLPSQEYKVVNEIPIPVYLTLQRLCKYVEDNNDKPDNFINYFQTDCEATPPFLIVLGMHHPPCQKQIARIYMQLIDSQIEAICLGFSENELCRNLDDLFEVLRLDQIKTALASLCIKLGTLYITHKTEQLQALYKKIQEDQGRIKFEMSLNIALDELEALITNQHGRIRQVLNPINLQIKKYVLSLMGVWDEHFSTPPQFLKMFDTCQQYLLEIEGPNGLLKQIQKKKPITPSNDLIIDEVINENILRRLNIKNQQKLRSQQEREKIGIKTGKDLEILGIPQARKKAVILRKYLNQVELEDIWIFFKSKGLCTLEFLKDCFVIQKSEEALNLKVLAEKFGYESKVPTEKPPE